MKKTLECEATALPDGLLAVPGEVADQITARKAVKVHLRLKLEEPAEDHRDGWQILRELPQTAGAGKQTHMAKDHDRILYGNH